MTGEGDPAGSGARSRRRLTIVRLLVFALVLTAPVWAGSGGVGATSLDRGLVAATEERKFSLVGWTASALSERIARVVAPTTIPAGTGTEYVREYVQLTGEIQSEDSRARLVASGASGVSRDADLAGISASRAALASRREAIRPVAESTIAGQLDALLAELGIRERTVGLATTSRFPFLWLQIRPGVAFRLGESPDVLIVSPRDRIQVVGSALLRPGTGIVQAEAIESEVDRLGVSSIVTRTGGLAAYPTVVVPTASLPDLLATIAHEWTHQYLMFTDLGVRYFASYDMRTINETTADLVGRELGDIAYNRYYGGAAPSQIAAPVRPSGPSFGDLMGEIRVGTEAYLRQGDVAGAERYMAEQRLVLVGLGYQVRKLNTAYLSFFGSYSAGENPYEPKLRQLREQTGSLALFLETASTIRTPADLDDLLARTR